MEFSDFNIEIQSKRGEIFEIRAASRASGDVQGTFSLKRPVDDLLQALQTSVADVRSASAGRHFTRSAEAAAEPPTDVGQELFDILFTSRELSRALTECMKDAENSGLGVRLRLTLNTKDPDVADLGRLPWELLYDDSKYKYFSRRPDFSIVRYLEVPKPSDHRQFQPPLRILVVSANPRNDLSLDKERDNLTAALAGAPNIAPLTFIDKATI